MELWHLRVAIVAGLAFLSVTMAAGWWLGYHTHVDEALELYCRTGGFWHRGGHYDVRRTNAHGGK